jgi:2-methylcitrate dehydratase PrpD
MNKDEVRKEAYTLRLADKITNLTFKNLDESLIRRAKEAVLDTIGVTIEGSRTGCAELLNNHIEELGGRKDATIIGRNRKTSPSNAALLNTACGHALDYDDVSVTVIGHPAVVTLFPALALGEKLHASGEDILSAFIAGYETIASIARGVIPEFNQKGWQCCSTLGVFGATAAASKIVGLNVEHTATAFGIAGALASGVKENFGTMTKPLQVGKAASNGITAALLAGNGFTASPRILEGKYGFCSVFAPRYDLEKMVEIYGQPYDLVSGGAIFKKWAACYAFQPCIEAIILLSEENDLLPGDISKIEIKAAPMVIDNHFYDIPKTGIEGKFSANFCAAVALAKRKAGSREFSETVLHDPVIKTLMPKVTLHADPELSQHGYLPPEKQGPTRTKVVITLDDNRVLSREIPIAKGAPSRRLSVTELIDKFKECAGTILTSANINNVIDFVLNLERIKDISPLMEMLRV